MQCKRLETLFLLWSFQLCRSQEMPRKSEKFQVQNTASDKRIYSRIWFLFIYEKYQYFQGGGGGGGGVDLQGIRTHVWLKIW